MQKALFLDRDGVINRERGTYTYQKEDLELLPDVPKILKKAQKKGFLLIVISNQGGIAKGLYSEEELETLHEYLRELLDRYDVALTDIFYSPHHEVRSKSLTKKPSSLLLERAIAKYRIDPSLSYFIGDKESDILAGKRAGIRAIRIRSNTSLKQIEHLLL